MVISLDVLEHTVDPVGIVKRLLKGLKIGGYFLVHYPNEDDFSCAHLKVANEKRPETFRILKKECITIEPHRLYQKK